MCVFYDKKHLKIEDISKLDFTKNNLKWKIERQETTVLPNDYIPYLIGIHEKYPKKIDTEYELNMGKIYRNRWIYYWASTKSSTYIIKKAPDAYGKKYMNKGITKSDKKGKIIFRLECPQPYKIDNKTIYPHIHFMISNKKNEDWLSKIYTVDIFCKINKKELKRAKKRKSHIIINIKKNKIEKKEDKGIMNIYYKEILEMTEKEIELEIEKNINLVNKRIKKLINKNKLSIKDIPIIIISKKKKILDDIEEKFYKLKYSKIYEYNIVKKKIRKVLE